MKDIQPQRFLGYVAMLTFIPENFDQILAHIEEKNTPASNFCLLEAFISCVAVLSVHSFKWLMLQCSMWLTTAPLLMMGQDCTQEGMSRSSAQPLPQHSYFLVESSPLLAYHIVC